MKSVFVDGRDVTDEPIEIKGEHISGVNVIFTDRMSSVSGAVRDAKGGPAANVTVIVFTEDEKLWFAQSRHINAARTNAEGGYRIAALPPGRLLCRSDRRRRPGRVVRSAFLDQIKNGAVRLTLGEGEQKTQDFKAPSSPYAK
jgi:hypothetical protein